MRSNPAEYELLAPANLKSVLFVLAEKPGAWCPIAGGTDLMVQYAAGTLAARKLVSIWGLPELRHIEVLSDEVHIGAGSTYTDLRASKIIQSEFQLLAVAASWTGGIANQNRGTIGGNIVNASPAADSLPALLAYEAELIIVSVRGERRVPYVTFHTGYRKTRLEPDELILKVCIPRRYSEYHTYARKVGPRNAQAISKVCVAALARITGGVVNDIRIAMGSVAPIPLRLKKTESTIVGRRIDAAIVSMAKRNAAAEIQAIDDVRSTARYRTAVTGNLVAEFLNQVAGNVS